MKLIFDSVDELLEMVYRIKDVSFQKMADDQNEMKGVLEFYADPDNYEKKINTGDGMPVPAFIFGEFTRGGNLGDTA